MQQGSFADSQHWTHRALSHLNRGEVGGAADTHMALASARMYVDGLTPDSEASWKAAYAAAGSEQRPPQLMSFVVLWGAYMRAARYHSAQAMLDEATWLLGPDVSPSDRALTYWILGSGAHYLGDQATTRLHMGARRVHRHSGSAGAAGSGLRPGGLRPASFEFGEPSIG